MVPERGFTSGGMIVSGEWIICEHCSLKYRAREPVCPRCEKPSAAGQTRWSDHRGAGLPPPRSKFVIAAPVVLLLVGGVGAVGHFLPGGFFKPSLAQKIAEACESHSGPDCQCVGEKTAGLMSAEQRAALELEKPETRELMQTASQLCLKDRLVSRCVGAKQGTELQCICIAEAAANAFTVTELHALFGSSPPPARYGDMREDCLAH